MKLSVHAISDARTSSGQAAVVKEHRQAAFLEEKAPSGGGRNLAARNIALDFTKGALVLIMVLYHWLNYFVGTEGAYYRYLRFLPPSFICITGFLVSSIYLARYQNADQRLFRRLAGRGMRLLALFIALNVLISLLPSGGGFANRLMLQFSPATLYSVYVSGNSNGERVVAFYILVSISYLLIASSFLAIISRRYKYVFHLATVLSLAAVALLGISGQSSQTLELLAIGLLGVSIGYIPMSRLEDAARKPFLIAGVYLLYLAAITVWNTPFYLETVGVLITLLLLYAIGVISGCRGALAQTIAFLGRYSLFGYITQIAVLRLLHVAMGRELGIAGLAISLAAGAALTTLSVWCVDRARSISPLINRAYSLVFT